MPCPQTAKLTQRLCLFLRDSAHALKEDEASDGLAARSGRHQCSLSTSRAVAGWAPECPTEIPSLVHSERCQGHTCSLKGMTRIFRCQTQHTLTEIQISKKWQRRIAVLSSLVGWQGSASFDTRKIFSRGDRESVNIRTYTDIYVCLIISKHARRYFSLGVVKGEKMVSFYILSKQTCKGMFVSSNVLILSCLNIF